MVIVQSMSKTSHANTTVAVVCNPTSNKGKGAQVGGHVIDLLRGAGRKHGFDVIDVTGTSFDDSLANARRRGDEYDYLVAVGGDGMVALGANAVGCSGKTTPASWPSAPAMISHADWICRSIASKPPLKALSVRLCAGTYRRGHGLGDFVA